MEKFGKTQAFFGRIGFEDPSYFQENRFSFL
jgi:hypothetical protein